MVGVVAEITRLKVLFTLRHISSLCKSLGGVLTSDGPVKELGAKISKGNE